MISTLDINWVAGFLEGEGCFREHRHTATIIATQVQKEPLERLEKLFGGRITTHAPYTSTRQQSFRWYVLGQRAIEVMETVYTLMSPKRKEQIKKVLLDWKDYKYQRGPYRGI